MLGAFLFHYIETLHRKEHEPDVLDRRGYICFGSCKNPQLPTHSMNLSLVRGMESFCCAEQVQVRVLLWGCIWGRITVLCDGKGW